MTIEEQYLECLTQVLLGKASLDDVEAVFLQRLHERSQKHRDIDQASLRNVVGKTGVQCGRVLDRFLSAQRRVEREE